MANYFVLSRDQIKAKKEFISFLNQSDETLVLVLWDDDTAVSASDFVRRIAESNEGDLGIYRFVNFLVSAQPDSVIGVLADLDNLSGIDVNNLEDHVIISISPFRNIISEAISKSRFDKGKGSVTTAILRAMKNG